MPKVIYLTGAPAAGKSSTTRLLVESSPSILVWEYGAKLTEYCSRRDGGIASQSDIRSRSASVITPADVAAVDNALLAFLAENRASRDVIIDSHPVTKESFGFRITPFSLEQFTQLRPDEIWVLYATPEETQRRIGDDPGGRPAVSEEEARMHTMLQASVAATYSMAAGCPAYLFDTGLPRVQILGEMQRRLAA